MLSEDRLAVLIERPEVQRRILGDYDGSFSLGLTLNPNDRSEVVIRLRIEDDDPGMIPSHVMLDGERVPVIVNPGFRAPTRLPLHVGR